MRAIASGMTDVGLQRDHNEDSYAVLAEYDLFIVADGMGGHRAGEDVASRLATDAIAEFFRSTSQEDATLAVPFRHLEPPIGRGRTGSSPGSASPNRRIFERSIRRSGATAPGWARRSSARSSRGRRTASSSATSVTAAPTASGTATFSQLTRDHSLINDYLMAMPGSSPRSKRAELPKNVITRALGMQDSVSVDPA